MSNIYDIWFARVEVSNSIKARLYEKFSTKEIFEFCEEDFLDLELNDSTIKKFLDDNYKKGLEKYMKYMDKNSIYQIFYKDEVYPEKLRKISNFPTYIFVRRKYRFNV